MITISLLDHLLVFVIGTNNKTRRYITLKNAVKFIVYIYIYPITNDIDGNGQKRSSKKNTFSSVQLSLPTSHCTNKVIIKISTPRFRPTRVSTALDKVDIIYKTIEAKEV